MTVYNLISFGGIFVLMGLAWLCSTERRRVNWRVVIWGTALQLLFALFIFRVPVGTKLFLLVNDLVVKVLDCATAGTKFLFGRLALPPGTADASGETSLGFFLAFQALPTIVFFAALMGALYYLGIMPWLVRAFASVFTRLMRLSGAESLCAASNIFVGIESALTIRPHLENMTRSELCTILTAGMATIASSVMALYVFVLQGQFPTIAGHLVSASIISAPAAVVMAKLMVPETGQPLTLGMAIRPSYEREHNLIEAIINGANSGVRLVVGIAALLLAFLGLVALVDLLLGALGHWLTRLVGLRLDLSLRAILSLVFYPLTLVIGVPPSDAWAVARLIGERTVATEVQSYQDLAAMLAVGSLQEPRSAVIAAYALCGFAHIASLAIFVGGIAALAPRRTAELSSLGFRALWAATLACLMTGAVAGTFLGKTTILAGALR
ncbi:MAG: nucleoside transporter [candidate division KSB1 bacterium]|nr:nucleoside transporter [candidate division KSB1 bacterium]MDZ7393015.1 nucleoside transporter [candidate division KSB1 bacterium]MDZ7412106.1 nucleoside transporter [candidate division KSB1 bacterium]